MREWTLEVTPSQWDRLLALFRRFDEVGDGTPECEELVEEFRSMVNLPQGWSEGDHIRWQVRVPARSFISRPTTPKESSR
jgi:hypothetical protein